MPEDTDPTEETPDEAAETTPESAEVDEAVETSPDEESPSESPLGEPEAEPEAPAGVVEEPEPEPPATPPQEEDATDEATSPEVEVETALSTNLVVRIAGGDSRLPGGLFPGVGTHYAELLPDGRARLFDLPAAVHQHYYPDIPFVADVVPPPPTIPEV